MFNKLTSDGLFQHLSQTYGALQSVTKFITQICMNLVTPKGVAKHELLFNKPTSGLRGGFDEYLSWT